MGTTGSTLQTWALMNGGRSSQFNRDRSKDYFFGKDAATPASTSGVLNLIAQAQTQMPTSPQASVSGTSTTGGGRTWTADELADYVAGTELSDTGDTDFYAGGLGLPSWATSAAKTATGIGGAMAGLPSPVTSLVGGVLGAGLGTEGINAHTVANAGINTMLGLNPITGLLNLGAKGVASLLGKEYDPANFLGETTGNYGLRSPNSLNLEMFNNNSNEAFGGYNQPTAARIAEQEASNRSEHENFADMYMRAQDEALSARVAAAERAAAEQAAKVAAAEQAPKLSPLQQSASSSQGPNTGVGSGFNSANWGSRPSQSYDGGGWGDSNSGAGTSYSQSSYDGGGWGDSNSGAGTSYSQSSYNSSW